MHISLRTVADISYDVAAIRQAIAKGLVAFYQKCESLPHKELYQGAQAQLRSAIGRVFLAFSFECKCWLLLMW